MTLQAQGIIRIITAPETTQVGDTTVTKLYGGISEGKDKNGEYINNAIEVVAWGKTGELIQNSFVKGDSFFANGTIRLESWEGKDGKRNKHTFKLNRMEFLPKPNSDTPQQAHTAVVDSGIPF